MRHSVLSSVLDVAAANSRFQPRIAIFEIGQIFLAQEGEGLPEEPARLALVMSGQREPEHWSGNSGQLTYYDLKGVLEVLFDELGVPVRWEAGSHPTFRPGRVAHIWLKDRILGRVGELHPLVVKAYDIRVDRAAVGTLALDRVLDANSSSETGSMQGSAGLQPVLAADLDLEPLLAYEAAVAFEQVSPYPPIHEDLAIVVDRALPATVVESNLREAGGALLRQVQLFDVYEGEQLPKEKKSLAYHLTYQAPDRTLTDKEAKQVRGRILNLLEQRLGARLR
jgi:phenylalanyl-tRNA synthetase beta chain